MTETSLLPGPCTENYDWQRHAACRQLNTEMFFHPENERGWSRRRREGMAKNVCRQCPVQSECLAHALSAREPYGVWGGLGEAERRELLKSSGTRRPEPASRIPSQRQNRRS
jgi:WhiB family transcriptional regulator, redox-sensing transcriptional regulator